MLTGVLLIQETPPRCQPPMPDSPCLWGLPGWQPPWLETELGGARMPIVTVRRAPASLGTLSHVSEQPPGGGGSPLPARRQHGQAWAGDIMNYECCQLLPDLGNPNIPLQESACGVGFGRQPQECGGEAPACPPRQWPVPGGPPSLRSSQGACASVRTSRVSCLSPRPCPPPRHP